jgi:hypothetical protein
MNAPFYLLGIWEVLYHNLIAVKRNAGTALDIYDRSIFTIIFPFSHNLFGNSAT